MKWVWWWPWWCDHVREPCTRTITCINRTKLANPDGIAVQIFSCTQYWFVGYSLNTSRQRFLQIVARLCWRTNSPLGARHQMAWFCSCLKLSRSGAGGGGGGHRLFHLTANSRFTVSCPKRGVQFERFCDLDSSTFSITVYNLLAPELFFFKFQHILYIKCE